MSSRREQLREASQGTGEVPDDEPVHIPGDSCRPMTLREEMRRFIREQISQHAEVNEQETFEEQDDFSEEDAEPDLLTAYSISDLEEKYNPNTSYALEGEEKPPTEGGDTPDAEPSLKELSESEEGEAAQTTEK